MANWFEFDDGLRVHASWGPKGHKMTDEEQKQFLQESIQRINEEYSKTVEVPIYVLKNVIDSLYKLNQLGKTDVSEITKPGSNVVEKFKINSALDMSFTLLEQYLPNEHYENIIQMNRD